ncbi:MAG: hypothetical protein WDN72_10695 [Alphaproteobacteria bacterium]
MSYDFSADLLNKFSQLTPWLQAVLGLGFCAVTGAAFYFMKETVAVVAGAKARRLIHSPHSRNDDTNKE